MWEQKFEQKRKALKEIEQQLNRENAELEKKLCLLQETYTRLDQDKRKQEAEYQEKIQEYEAQIQNLDSTAGEAYYYGNAQAESIMQLKTTMQDLERQLSDLQSTYDKDKALWEGKCQFLENQKENYKKDLIESQRKFEITLEQLQKRGNSAQDKYEYNQNALVKVIENKYKNQIKEMLESHQCLQSEFQNKNKRLEDENKTVTQQTVVKTREVEIEKQQLEQRLQEYVKQEACLKNDLDELRADRDKRIKEHMQQVQKDKEMFKQRIAEAEKKAKESDAKRTQMIFDMEKEKARWQMEYDNIVTQKRELEDIIANLERRKDLLFKENERLKVEWKSGSQSKPNRSSVERRISTSAVSNVAGPKLGLGLGSSLNQPTAGPHLGGPGFNHRSQKSSGEEKNGVTQSNGGNAQGKAVGLRGGIKSGLTGNSSSVRGSQQSLMPPHPQKYQIQLQQLQFQTSHSQ